MNKLIALVGMCGAGKSVVAECFIKKGYQMIHFGGSTMEEMKKRGLEVNEVNEKMVREDLRKQYGMAAYAFINLPRIETALMSGNVIIDGLYSWSEYKVLMEKFPDIFQVIAVHTTRKTRYERLALRPVRPLTAVEAFGRDKAEIENLEKGGPIVMADLLLTNDGTVEDLQRKLDEYF